MKILVVEDSSSKEKRVLSSICGVQGVSPDDVIVARSVIEARTKLSEHRFDVMILDIQIPQRNGERPRLRGGVELLDSVMTSKRIACPPHVIGLTAYGTDSDIETSFERNTSVIVKFDDRDTSWESKLQTKIDQILAHEDGDTESNSTTHYVVLVHGIRTHANWAEMVSQELRDVGIIPIPIRYGYLDALRFWCPFLSRRRPIRKVLRELRDLRSENPGAEVSTICHSFGTFSIFQCLLEPDVKLHRVIFCGSIVPLEFRRARFKAQLGSDPILNDCGTKDWWPVIAKTATWGFGPSGTFGFGSVGIRDRFNEYGHSDYFNREFVRTYWIPFLVSGKIVATSSETNRPPPSWLMSVPLWLQLKWVVLMAIAGVAISGFWLLST